MQKSMIILLGALIIAALLAGGAWYWSTQMTQSGVSTVTDPEVATEETDLLPTTPEEGAEVVPASEAIQRVIISDNLIGPEAFGGVEQTVFSPTSEDIKFTILLDQSVVAQQITLQIVLREDGSAIGPVPALVKEENGVKYAIFEMRKPSSNWPVGTYEATAELSSGEQSTVVFNVGS